MGSVMCIRDRVLNNGEFNHIDKKTMEIPEIRKAVLDILGETDNEII